MAVTREYREKLAQVESFLASKRAIVFATSAEGRVTARTVSLASRGTEILFMSFAANMKCRQIQVNARVALCRDNVQIEGTAEILGPVGSPANAKDAELLLGKYPEEFRRHVADPRMVLIRVRPSRIAVFRTQDGEYVVDRLDLERETLSVERIAESAE